MVNKEDYIRKKMAETNPFRVPDRYFDDFTLLVMEKLPKQAQTMATKRKPLHHTLRPVFYAAACICAILMSTLVYFEKSNNCNERQPRTTAAHSSVHSTEQYEEALTDYAMIDNVDIYAYLSNEQ